MTKFCIVAPPRILFALRDRDLMGEHHLLLAHDVVAKPDDYFALFGMRSEDPEELIILDNSAIELGAAVDLGIIAEAISIVNPSVVVLPDVLLDGEATARSCLDALEEWPKHLGAGVKFCYIPQGRRVTEFIASARAIAEHPLVTMWGCPRNVVKYHSSRAMAMQCLYEINPHRPIHMMGFSDNMNDDIACAKTYNAASIDSAVPLRLKHPLYSQCTQPPRGDWWEKGLFTELTAQNLEIARMWFH